MSPIATATAIVTGGATGIGAAVAAALAAAGHDVVITGRRREPLAATATALGSRVRAVGCDATDPDEVEAFAAALPGPVSALVNNAGGNTDFDRPAPDGLAAVAAAWRANLEANLISAVLMTTALLDRFTDDAALVHIGSIAADKGAGAYGAAKAGLASWNVALAGELGPRGITSNVVSPGYTAGTEFFRDRLTAQRRDAMIATAATRRAGTADDVAAAVAFLASPGARQITGQVVAVNGGERTTR